MRKEIPHFRKQWALPPPPDQRDRMPNLDDRLPRSPRDVRTSTPDPAASLVGAVRRPPENRQRQSLPVLGTQVHRGRT